jgi:hypothetical protein
MQQLLTQLYFINQFCIAITLLRTTYFEKPNPITFSKDRSEEAGGFKLLVI